MAAQLRVVTPSPADSVQPTEPGGRICRSLRCLGLCSVDWQLLATRRTFVKVARRVLSILAASRHQLPVGFKMSHSQSVCHPNVAYDTGMRLVASAAYSRLVDSGNAETTLTMRSERCRIGSRLRLSGM